MLFTFNEKIKINYKTLFIIEIFSKVFNLEKPVEIRVEQIYYKNASRFFSRINLFLLCKFSFTADPMILYLKV